jgi:hypothetical protein
MIGKCLFFVLWNSVVFIVLMMCFDCFNYTYVFVYCLGYWYDAYDPSHTAFCLCARLVQDERYL